MENTCSVDPRDHGVVARVPSQARLERSMHGLDAGLRSEANLGRLSTLLSMKTAHLMIIQRSTSRLLRLLGSHRKADIAGQTSQGRAGQGRVRADYGAGWRHFSRSSFSCPSCECSLHSEPRSTPEPYSLFLRVEEPLFRGSLCPYVTPNLCRLEDSTSIS
jgi:hypothetical protein